MKYFQVLAHLRPTRAPVLLMTALALSPAWAGDPVTDVTLYAFKPRPDAGIPDQGALTLGKDGNLYGTSAQGGTFGVGAIYRVAADGTETVLYSFSGAGDGQSPAWGLTRDSKGNFYGMANSDPTNRGTVFKITPAGAFTTLHTFMPGDSSNGYMVSDNGVVVGKDGKLYGVTSEGGPFGAGTFFRLSTNGSNFTTLLDFSCDNLAPCNPQGTLVQGVDGNFYGLSTGYVDAHGNNGAGTVYRITPAGVATTLHAFTAADGPEEPPIGSPRLDAAGNIYFFGGVPNLSLTGRVYKVDTSGVLSVLHQFTAADGTPGPNSSQLLLGPDNRLYGTTTGGGADGNGTIFGLGLDGSFAVLHDFDAATGDGYDATASPSVAADGSLWGTTRVGGDSGNGTVYRLNKPAVTFTVKPKTITAGHGATLTWSSADTTGCTPSGAWGPGNLPVSGTMKVGPFAAGTYVFTLACSGAGTATRSATLTVQ